MHSIVTLIPALIVGAILSMTPEVSRGQVHSLDPMWYVTWEPVYAFADTSENAQPIVLSDDLMAIEIVDRAKNRLLAGLMVLGEEGQDSLVVPMAIDDRIHMNLFNRGITLMCDSAESMSPRVILRMNPTYLGSELAIPGTPMVPEGARVRVGGRILLGDNNQRWIWPPEEEPPLAFAQVQDSTISVWGGFTAYVDFEFAEGAIATELPKLVVDANGDGKADAELEASSRR